MATVNERLDSARQSLATLRSLVDLEHPSPIERDAALLRLAVTVEGMWKAAQVVLARSEGVEVGSPKGCVRACVDAAILAPEDAADILAAIDDRNLDLHAYSDAIARGVAERLPRHTRALEAWILGLTGRSAA